MKDSDFDNWFIKYYSSITPPKLKIRVYLDRNLPAFVVDDFKSVAKIYKIIKISKENEEDAFIYKDALNKKTILFTCDDDFWDDRKFPLHLSPGVIIVKGKSSDEIDRTIASFVMDIGFIKNVRLIPGFFLKQKFKINISGYVTKYLTVDRDEDLARHNYLKEF